MLQSGLCHSASTTFIDHVLDTSMQFLKSMVELSFEKQEISNSGGRRLIRGMWRPSSIDGDIVMSLKEATPREDWESLRWFVKKSVSSYTACSGELEEEETDAVSLAWSVASWGCAMTCL